MNRALVAALKHPRTDALASHSQYCGAFPQGRGVPAVSTPPGQVDVTPGRDDGCPPAALPGPKLTAPSQSVLPARGIRQLDLLKFAISFRHTLQPRRGRPFTPKGEGARHCCTRRRTALLRGRRGPRAPPRPPRLAARARHCAQQTDLQGQLRKVTLIPYGD